MPEPTRWCVNIHGPDDVIATATYLDAVAKAMSFNRWWHEYRTAKPLHEQFDARMWAVPIEWPHDVESHARALAEPSSEYEWLKATRDTTELDGGCSGAQAVAVSADSRNGPSWGDQQPAVRSGGEAMQGEMPSAPVIQDASPPSDTPSLSHPSSLVPTAEQGVVAVKPLEWREKPATEKLFATWHAAHIFPDVDDYFIVQTGRFEWQLPGVIGGQECATLDEAKAAAQADFESRIRSALTPPIAGAGEELARRAIAMWRDSCGIELIESVDILQRHIEAAIAASLSQLYSRIGELERERDEARKLFDECAAARDAAGFIGAVPQCIAFLDDSLQTAEAKLAEARDVLEPFAKFAAHVATAHPGWDHDDFTFAGPLTETRITMREFRRARSFHSPKEPGLAGGVA